jgi:glycine/D-amino acid oxidase-like deaminating enzyme
VTLFTGEASPGHAYWWDGFDWPTLTGDLPEKIDLLVIGAGYTGLSAAIAAHDKGAKVVVIDAGRPGCGASTRNGGMVGAHPRLSWEKLASQYGADTADGIFGEAAPALDWVKALIAREGIDCDYQETGRIQLAYTETHFAGQQKLASGVSQKSGVACEVVSKEELLQEIDTPLYHGGLLFPQHGALQPAKFHLGLLNAVLRRGIPVIENCPAENAEKIGAQHSVRTPKGVIAADKIVLATNGYTPKSFRWFARRVFPLPSFLIATEPLSENLIKTLAPGGRMMVETRARHSYFRISPDGQRIIYGGRAFMVPADLSMAATRLHQTMCEVWPDLESTKVSHVWTGNTGYSFGHMPQVGELDGIHFAMGYSGSGTVMAPYLGAKAALQALGDPEGETAYSRTELTPRWFHIGGRPHFLQVADFWYRNWVDRRETRQSKSS